VLNEYLLCIGVGVGVFVIARETLRIGVTTAIDVCMSMIQDMTNNNVVLVNSNLIPSFKNGFN
jgi:hypothetical protein